nr:FAD-dependent monooxygenase [Nonomuraea basaltis]
MDTPARFRVAIIGGGLGGLCLAHGLRRSGVGVAVYERDTSATFRSQGYRISLKASGADALHDCLPSNLFDLCVATSIRQATRMVFMDPQLNPGFDKPTPPADSGMNGFGVNRLTLREILLADLADTVRFGATFERFEQTGDGRVRAWFADGTSTVADLLVGADGTHSAVRAQLIPDAIVDELHWVIYGKTPITDTTLEWVPDILVDAFARVTRDSEQAFAMATCRTREPVSRAAARLAPGLRLTDIPGYFQWITPLADASLHSADAAVLHRHAADQVRDLHAAIGRLIAEADIAATFPVCVASAWPVDPWHDRVPNVTLLGDAVHTMSPGRGDGANIALHDASILRDALARATAGKLSFADAIAEYETQTLRYGFAAAAASRDSPFTSRSFSPPASTALSCWDQFAATHTAGDIVEATVTGHLPIGAFVHVTDGVDGILIGAHPAPGSRLAVRIKDIDLDKRRLSVVTTGHDTHA